MNDQLGPPAPWSITLLLLVIAFIAGMGVVTVFKGMGTERLTGVLEVERTLIAADQPGRVLEVYPAQGTSIESGTAIAKIERADLLELRQDDKNRLGQLRREREQLIASQTRWIDNERVRLREQVGRYAGLRDKTDRMIAELQRSSESGSAAVATVVEVDQVRLLDQIATLEQERQAVGKSLSEAERQLNALRPADQTPEVLELDAEIKKLVSRVEENTEVEHLIRSPATGSVIEIAITPGSLVEPGLPIARVFDQGRRFLSVAVPQRLLSQVSAGTKLQLIFPGDQERDGIVSPVPITTPLSDPGGPVLVRVEQNGMAWPDVPIGSEVRVEIPSAGTHE